CREHVLLAASATHGRGTERQGGDEEKRGTNRGPDQHGADDIMCRAATNPLEIPRQICKIPIWSLSELEPMGPPSRWAPQPTGPPSRWLQASLRRRPSARPISAASPGSAGQGTRTSERRM